MDIFELVKANRSCRRFDQFSDHKIDTAILEKLVDLGRCSASAANLQPLKYMISSDSEKNKEIFSCLTWAAYLKDWQGPKQGERPSAYIVIMGDTGITKNFRCDHGIAAQSILLGARALGFAGCMLAAIDHKKLKRFLKIGDHLEILLVIALGPPLEEVRLEDLTPGNNIKYWRDGNNIHHVPKRRLEEIILCSW